MDKRKRQNVIPDNYRAGLPSVARLWHALTRALSRVVLLLAGLLSSEADAQRLTLRDSAGIKIIENPSAFRAPIVFRLGEPTLDVGGIQDDPRNEFDPRFGNLSATRLQSGSLAVSERTRVHVFDPHGERTGMVGVEGRGPLEYQYVVAICEVGVDTLVVNDQGLKRGSLIARRRVAREFLFDPRASVPRQFCFADGTLLTVVHLPSSMKGPQFVRLVRIDLTGKVLNVVADELNTGPFDGVVGREPLFAARGVQCYFATALDSEIAVRSLAGRLLALIRSADPPRRVSSEEIAEMPPVAWRRGASAREVKETQARLAAESGINALPTYRRLLVDAIGRIWVLIWEPAYTKRIDRWIAFSKTGVLLGALEIPSASRDDQRRVVEFGANEVIIQYLDQDGSLHVRSYRLLPASTGN